MNQAHENKFRSACSRFILSAYLKSSTSGRAGGEKKGGGRERRRKQGKKIKKKKRERKKKSPRRYCGRGRRNEAGGPTSQSLASIVWACACLSKGKAAAPRAVRYSNCVRQLTSARRAPGIYPRHFRIFHPRDQKENVFCGVSKIFSKKKYRHTAKSPRMGSCTNTVADPINGF